MSTDAPGIGSSVVWSRARRALPPLLCGLFGLAVFLALWQWRGTQPDAFAIAPPTKVFPALWTQLTEGVLVGAILNTLAAAAVGYVIASVIGVSLGILIGLSDGWFKNTLEPLAYAAYSAPVVLAIPVLGIYTGLGFRGVVALTVLWCVFEILITTIAGVREAPAGLIDVARSFNAKRWRVYLQVVIPAAFPYIVVGLRLGVGRALRGAVTAQLLLTVVDLGLILRTSGATYDMATMLATIVVVVIIGMVAMKAAEVVEERVLKAIHARV